MIEEWEDIQDQYWAVPEEEEKDFPFQGAANIVVPITAIAVEAIFARLYMTLWSVDPYFSIRPIIKEWIDAAPFVEKWLQTEVENPTSLNMQQFSKDTLLEFVKLGTCVGKSGYERVTKKVVTIDEDNNRDESFIKIRDGATADYVPLARFLMRIAYHDPQTAPWCGEEHEYSWRDLKRMVVDGRMISEAIDEIKVHWGDNVRQSGSGKSYDDTVDKLTNQEPLSPEEFDVQELWVTFDVDGDGLDEEIVVDLHRDSRTICSIRYNWNSDLHRPYRGGNYIPVEGRFYGIGIGKQNEQFQDEITTVHRQRLDNATLANMKMIAFRKTSTYGPGEPIWPGKMWFFDDPNSDVREISMSEIYNSAYANEDGLWRISEKRTGVNDTILGIPTQGTPGTATEAVEKLQEGTKKFDMALKQYKQFGSLIGTDILANYQQFGDSERHWIVQGEDGKWVEHIFELPPQLVRDGAIVELTVTDSVTNKQVERQQWMSLFQVISQYYERRIQLAMMIQQMPPDAKDFQMTAFAAISAGDEAFTRLLDTYNIVNKEALLLNPIIEEMQNELGASGAGGGGGQGLAGIGESSGMESLFAGGGPAGDSPFGRNGR